MTDGHRLYVTVTYGFDYGLEKLDHLTEIDIVTQFFEHRNGITGYVSDEEGGRIEEGSELGALVDKIYEAFDNGNVAGLVEQLLLDYEMYEVLAEYHKRPLSEEAIDFKHQLLETKIAA